CSPGERGKRSAHRADRPGSPPVAALVSLVNRPRRVTTSTASARERARTGAPTPASAARAVRLPAFVEPQLATLVAIAPCGHVCLHETEPAGHRALCRVDNGRATLWSRTAQDWTSRFPTGAAAAARLPARQAFLDGEIAVMLSNGTTSFQALQNELSA